MKRWTRRTSRRNSRVGQRKLKPNFQQLERRDLLATDVFEPNDTFSEAKDLSSTVNVTIEPAGDIDIFRWTAPDDGYVRFDALFQHAQGDLDMRLYNSVQTPIDSSITSTDNERVATAVSQGDELFVQISEFSGTRAVPYTLGSTFIQPDAFDNGGASNDSIASARDLGIGDKSISNLNIHQPGDADYFRWTATFDGILTATASFLHFEGDIGLRILSSSGLELTSSQTMTDNEQASLNVVAGASYIIEVTEAQGMEDPSYDLDIGFNAPPEFTSFPTGVVLGPIGGTTLVSFSIDDINNPVSSLSLSGSSTDSFLVPTQNITFTGTGNDRTAVIESPGGFGMTTITITVTDPDGASTSDSFELWLFADNASPVISNIGDFSIPRNGASATRNFTVSDGQTPASQLVVTASSSNTTVVPNTSNNIILGGSGENRTIRIRPASNQLGTSVVTVNVTDGDSDSSSSSFLVTVFDPANRPTITPISDVIIDEGSSTNAIPFAISDADTPIAALTVSASSSDLSIVPTSGILISGSFANRSITVTPAVNASGTATITLMVSDGSATAMESFNVTVTSINDLPTISAIRNFTIQENSSTPVTPFTVGDEETAPEDLIITASTNNPFLLPVSNIVIAGTGTNRTVTATPIPTRQGAAIVTLTVEDTEGGQTEGAFVVTVLGDDDPPTITPISDVTVQNGIPTDIAFTVTDDGKPSAALFVGAFSSNELIIDDDDLQIIGTNDNRSVRITPSGSGGGPVVVSIIVSDGVNNTTELFNVTVIDGAPTMTPIVNQIINEDTSTAALDFTITDPDSPIGLITVSASSSDPSIIPDENIVITGTGANRTVTVTPVADMSGGPTTITLTASDGTNSSNRTFDVSVTPVDDPPTISVIGNQVIDEDSSTGAINFTISDIDTAVELLAVTAASSQQDVVPDSGVFIGGTEGNRTVTVIPAANANGVTTVTLTVSDGTSMTSTSFDVTVNALNDGPTISDIADQVIDEDGTAGPLDFTVGDIDTPLGDLTVIGTSSDPALVPNANIVVGGSEGNRTVTVTPAEDANGGPVTITLTVSDGASSANTSFNMTINPVDDAPTITTNVNQVIIDEDGTTGALNFSVSDPETAADALTVTATSDDQALIPDGNIVLAGSGADRTVQVTPAANVSGGPTTVTLTVSDGTQMSSTSFEVRVNAVDDSPTISAIDDQVVDEDGTTGAIDFTVGDLDTPVGDLTVSATSSDQMLVPDANIVIVGDGANRTVSVTPAANASGGPAIITVTVSDGSTSSSTMFDVAVTPGDDAPSITAINDQTIEEDGTTGPLNFTVGDLETAPGSLTVTAVSSDQNLVPNGNIVLAGGGADRTVTITPADHANGGPATITLTVSDGTNTSSTTFDVNVTAVNDLPTISSIDDQMIDQNGSSGALNFTVGDVETAATSLTVTAVSSDPALVPDANIVVEGTGVDRTVTVTPAADVTGGPVTITLTVNDGTTSANETFQVTIKSVERVVGDSNGDGVFSSDDLVKVLANGEYEDGIDGNSTFEEGDWNGDGDFDTSDFVFAFQANTYVSGALPTDGADAEGSSGDNRSITERLIDLALADLAAADLDDDDDDRERNRALEA